MVVRMQVRTLMEQKYGLDSKVSELSAKHGSASGELSVAREELDKLRAQNKELDAQAHASEKTMHHDAVKITALEQQVRRLSRFAPLRNKRRKARQGVR